MSWHPSILTQNSNHPPLEDIPSAPVRQEYPWPNAGSASKNLFETRKDWPFPSTAAPTPAPTIKTEEPPKIAAIPHAMVMPKQATEKCSWGLHIALFAKNEEEHEEDWDGDLQNQPRMQSQKTISVPNHRVTNTLSHSHKCFQCPQLQKSQQSFDVPDRYAEQIKLRKEWEERIKHLNGKVQTRLLFKLRVRLRF